MPETIKAADIQAMIDQCPTHGTLNGLPVIVWENPPAMPEMVLGDIMDLCGHEWYSQTAYDDASKGESSYVCVKCGKESRVPYMESP